MTHTRLRIAAAATIITVAVAVTAVTTTAGGPPASTRTATSAKQAVAVDRAHHAPTTEAQPSAAAAPAGTFTAITPYRAYDTRVNGPDKVRAGDDFNVDMLADYQNIPMIPASATAIAFNVTVTDTESTFGFVTLFNGDATAIPGTSTINWVLPGFTIANGGIVALAAPGPYVGSIGIAMDGAVDAAAGVIVDVTGYYTP